MKDLGGAWLTVGLETQGGDMRAEEDSIDTDGSSTPIRAQD